MKLMNKTLEARFAKVGSQDGKGNEAIVIAKFFNPVGAATWWATEYDPATREFFGYVSLWGGVNDTDAEWGYFSLDELESLRLPLGMKIERDRYFGKRKVSEVPEIRKF